MDRGTRKTQVPAVAGGKRPAQKAAPAAPAAGASDRPADWWYAPAAWAAAVAVLAVMYWPEPDKKYLLCVLIPAAVATGGFLVALHVGRGRWDGPAPAPEEGAGPAEAPAPAATPATGFSGPAAHWLLGALLLVLAACAWQGAVALLSTLALGVPVRWLLGGRKPLAVGDWLQAPFLGVAAVILPLQDLVYLDVPVRQSAPWLWAAAALGWGWFLWAGRARASLAQCPSGVFAAAVAVYLVQGLGLLTIGAPHYLGVCGPDALNYTTQTQFLVDERHSLGFDACGPRPWLIEGINYKWDRIGESILHGFCTTVGGNSAKEWLEPTQLLGPALVVLAVYLLGRRLGVVPWQALAAGMTAGLLPGFARLHLSSYLSQILATPLTLYFPVVLADLHERPDWRRLLAAAMLFATIVNIYTEFLVIVLGLIALTYGVGIPRHPRAGRLTAWYAGLAVAPFFFNPWLPKAIQIVRERLAIPMPNPFFRDVATLAGVLFGRGVYRTGGPGTEWTAGLRWADWLVLVAVIGLCLLGFAGLFRFAAAQVFGSPGAWRHAGGRRALAVVLGVTALLSLPVIVKVKDPEESYRFLKLFFSFAPVLILGLCLVSDAGGRGETAATAGRTPAVWHGLLLGAAFAGAASGTLNMVFQSTTLTPEGHDWGRGYLLLAPEVRELEDQLQALHGKNLLLACGDRGESFEPPILNAWFAYFARDNRLWMTNPVLQFAGQQDLRYASGLESVVDLSNLPPDLLVLSGGGRAFLQSPPANATVVWANKAYSLWQPADRRWALPFRLDAPRGVEQAEGQPLFWVGPDQAALEVVAASAGHLVLEAKFRPGPEATQPATCQLHVAAAGQESDFSPPPGEGTIRLAVPAGRVTITLSAAGQAVPLLPPEQGPSGRLVGVQGLRVRWEP